jgi:hypothetical protein
MDSILTTPHSRYIGDQLAAILKEVQMAPTLLCGVVYAAKLTALRALELGASAKVQNDLQDRRLATN